VPACNSSSTAELQPSLVCGCDCGCRSQSYSCFDERIVASQPQPRSSAPVVVSLSCSAAPRNSQIQQQIMQGLVVRSCYVLRPEALPVATQPSTHPPVVPRL
jgi:hypothetical protein